MVIIARRDLPLLGFSVVSLGLRIVPQSIRFRLLRALAAILGRLWYSLDRSDVALTRRNLQALMGTRLPASETENVLRGVYRHLALDKLTHTLADRLTPREFNDHWQVEGESHLRRALDQGRGVLLLGTHFCFPGYVPIALLSARGFTVSAVLGEEVETDSSWFYRRIILPIRSLPRPHFRLIAPDGRPQRQLVDCLRQNQVLIILGDALDEDNRRLQPPHVLPVRLLDIVLTVKSGPIRLAKWLGTPVVPYFMVPQPDGFVLRIEPALALNPDHSAQGLTEDLVAFFGRFETYLVRYPALWAHLRHTGLTEFLPPAQGSGAQVLSAPGATAR